MLDLTDIRKYLHKNPELSGKEKNTAQYVRQQLKSLNLTEIHKNVGMHAVLAVKKFGDTGPVVLFRAELDALPITEINDFPHKSTVKNVSHKCGHDGHMTMLLGLAEKLSNARFDKGTVLFLFQSAEENGEGAKAVLESEILDNYPIDYVFALHNIPGLQKNAITCKVGNFTPAVSSINIYLEGKTSHAAEPESGHNPALFIAEIIKLMESLHQPKTDKDNFLIMAPIQIKMGSDAYGTTAGSALVSYTVRTWENDALDTVKTDIDKKLNQLSTKFAHIKLKTEWVQDFKANVNDKKAYEYIKKASEYLDLNFLEKEYPFSWGEDFGVLTSKFKGAMFGLGSGSDCPALHNPDYDFPDEIAPTGISLFFEILNSIQKNE